NIDTGMGLERCASVLQGVETNYHIDILRPIVEAAAEVCGVKYEPQSDNGRRLRRITDHVRACTMALHENVYPGPQKEKYVIRRLLRRSILDGHQMGMREPFLYQLVPAVVDMMKTPYPDLTESVDRVASVMKSEEENFLGTLDAGLAHIDQIFGKIKSANRTTVDGREAADLYQTYGVPPELFESMAAEHNLAFDWEGFKTAMEEHGVRSGILVHTVMGDTGPIDAIKKVLHDVEFLGYETTEATAELKFIVAQNQLCEQLDEVCHERQVIVVLDRSPFYGESGGQVGDTGEIVGDGFRFQVIDTQKNGHLILHIGHLLEGQLKSGATVTARVDCGRRDGIRRAHSATHILHHALQSHLGKHAQQQGSKVDRDWLRFDFTNMSPVEAEQLVGIERDVNARIAASNPIKWENLPLAEARKAGAMMLFGEKYPDPVRMVSMGEFSKELCGGTHLMNTSEVGAFEIVSEESVSAGTRRIEALTGDRARENGQRTRDALSAAAEKLGTSPLAVPDAVRELIQSVRELRKSLSAGAKGGDQATASPKNKPTFNEASYAEMKSALRETARALNVAPFDVPERVEALLGERESLREQIEKLSQAGDLSADSLLDAAQDLDGVKLIVADLPSANPNLMRQLIDQIRQKTSPVAVLLAAPQGDDKALVVAGVSRELVDRGAHAGNWVREVAAVLGGGGGGKPDMAQAGGKDPSKLPEAMQKALEVIRQQLQ
ncbi:MAG: alanine--tRNA ligase, partial [Planctomycetales bacterium]|nr:alanine--tRNA ligase [Planctomycetales bacterium]